ncbi:hypothetical protein OAC39_01675 [Gammaproteobacteria bacterium]|nr:hypothetical protein [Gammaproteobacteria bacterium]
MKKILLTLMVFGSFGVFADVRQERLALEKYTEEAKASANNYCHYIKLKETSSENKTIFDDCYETRYETIIENYGYVAPPPEFNRLLYLNGEIKVRKPNGNVTRITEEDRKKIEKNTLKILEKAKEKARKEKALAKYWDGRKEDAKAAREEAELQEKIDRAVANEVARCSPNC